MTTNWTAMSGRDVNARVELSRDATLRLPRTGALVRVERGTVLVTREGDEEDHVLEPGEEFLVPAGGLAVAWALSDAAMSVRARPRARLPIAEPGRAA